MKKVLNKQSIGILLAAIAILLTQTLQVNGLSPMAFKTFGVLVATIIMLVFETMNVTVTSLLSVALLVVCGCVTDISQALSGYANHILYFTIASFGISFALQKSVLMDAFLIKVLSLSKKSTRGVTFSFMLCTAIISAFISNVAAVILFLPYANRLCQESKKFAQGESFRKSLVICTTVSAMLGGMITPAGSSINLLCLDALSKYANIRVRFIDWILVGAPIAFGMLFVSLFVVTAIKKPPKFQKQQVEQMLQSIKSNQGCSARDFYILLVVIAAIVAWVLSSWFPQINITVVALIALALLFVPKANVLTWEEFSTSISWPTFFIAGTMITLSQVATQNGLFQFVMEQIPTNLGGIPEIALVALAALVTFVFLIFVPVAPAAVTTLVPTMIAISLSSNVNVTMVAMTCSLCVCNCYLLPLDTVMVVAYEQKAFQMFELPRVTVFLQMAMILICALWMPIVFRLL